MFPRVPTWLLFSPTQNYMLNSKVNEELAAAAGVEEGDVVLEIGQGTGSLTAALLEATRPAQPSSPSRRSVILLIVP